MKDSNLKLTTPRRQFLGTLAAGAAAMGIATLASPLALSAEDRVSSANSDDPDAWFNKIKGKHRMVFDVTHPNGLFPFAWPKVFLMTNQATGTEPKDNNVVVILRHDGIPYAFEDRIWEKYKFGDVFKADDPATKASSVRNPFWKTKPDDFKIPGLGSVDIGIPQLQDIGVMFCVCSVALTVYTTVIGQRMNMDPAEVKKDWLSGLLPGIQPVPSGIWALGRAQEHGCAYCSAG